MLGFLLLFGCNREDLIPENQDISKAKQMIESKQSLPVLKYTKEIQWEKAIVSNGKIGKTIEAPFLLEKNLKIQSKKYELLSTYNRLLFKEQQDGSFKVYHVIIYTNQFFDTNDSSKDLNTLFSTLDGYITILNSQDKAVDLSSGIEKPFISNRSMTSREEETCTYLIEMYDDGTYEYRAKLFCGGIGAGDGPAGSTKTGGANGGGATGTTGETKDPCAKIKEQLAIANIKAKIDELKKKTNLKIESGYSQSRQGPFTALTPSAGSANTDAVNFPMDANAIGYIHTHLDNYERVKTNGDVESVEPIRMFSPDDVKQFLILVLNANRYNIPISDVYGTMVSSKGIYQLRFIGNVADVSQKASSINWGSSLNILYKEIMDNNSLEKGFLKFLNENIGINGIELYKIEDSGNSKKTLSNTGTVTSINCN